MVSFVCTNNKKGMDTKGTKEVTTRISLEEDVLAILSRVDSFRSPLSLTTLLHWVAVGHFILSCVLGWDGTSYTPQVTDLFYVSVDRRGVSEYKSKRTHKQFVVETFMTQDMTPLYTCSERRTDTP